jgi:hypothetical protein
MCAVLHNTDQIFTPEVLASSLISDLVARAEISKQDRGFLYHHTIVTGCFFALGSIWSRKHLHFPAHPHHSDANMQGLVFVCIPAPFRPTQNSLGWLQAARDEARPLPSLPHSVIVDTCFEHVYVDGM